MAYPTCLHSTRTGHPRLAARAVACGVPIHGSVIVSPSNRLGSNSSMSRAALVGVLPAPERGQPRRGVPRLHLATLRSALAVVLLVVATGATSARSAWAQPQPKVDTLSDDPAVLYSLRNRMLAGQDQIEFAITGPDRTVRLTNGGLPEIDSAAARTIIGTCGSSRIVVSRPGETTFRIKEIPDLELRDITIDGNLEKSGDGLALVRLTGGSSMNAGTKVVATGGNLELRVSRDAPFKSDLELSGGSDVTLDAWTDGTTSVVLNTACLDLGTAGTHSIESLSGDACSRLELGQTTLSIVGDQSTTFAGQITGEGTLRKVGRGTFTLEGSSTHSGGTAVLGGTLSIDFCADIVGPVTVGSGATLSVDGIVQGGATTIGAGGTLSGHGLLTNYTAMPLVPLTDPAVVNEGTVAPGHSIGQLTVTGDFVNRPSGTLLMEIGGGDPIEADLLSIIDLCILGSRCGAMRPWMARSGSRAWEGSGTASGSPSRWSPRRDRSPRPTRYGSTCRPCSRTRPWPSSPGSASRRWATRASPSTRTGWCSH